jgi:hypothetical protein
MLKTDDNAANESAVLLLQENLIENHFDEEGGGTAWDIVEGSEGGFEPLEMSELPSKH